MARVDGTCRHAVPVADADGYGRSDVPDGSLDDGIWRCPHEAQENGLCVFHDPDANDAAADALRDALGDGGEESRRATGFVDATVGAIEWPADASVGHPQAVTHLTHVTFAGPVDFSNCTIEAGVSFVGCTFADEVDFSGATFEGDPEFKGATFADEADFARATFRAEVRAGGVTFEAGARFYRAVFEADFNAKYADFHGRATFWKSTVGGTIRFNDATFHPLDGTRDPASNESEADTRFHALKELDLSNANFTDATLRDVDLEASELYHAKLFGTDLRSARLYGTVLTDSRIDDRTRFLGTPDDDAFSLGSLVRFWDAPRCVYDPAYDGERFLDRTEGRNRAKNTYRSIETVAGAASRPALQSRCFVGRQDIHRRTYREEVRHGTAGPTAGAAADTSGTPDVLYRTVRLIQWGRAGLSRWTLLYGESPWRVIATGLLVVLAFALLYPLGGLEPTAGPALTYGAIAADPALFFDSVYFSTLTFTTLGMGDFQPVGFARVLMTLQSSLGAVVIALLVFVFGRRAAR